MESIKYFIPEIEDIRVGYECQIRLIENAQWTTFKVGESNYEDVDAYEYLRLENLRVPYLTKEQIEKNLEMSGISCIFDSDKCILKLYDDKNTYFYGLCKSVNELRQLLGYIKSAI